MITSYFQVCKNTKTPYSTKVYPYLLFSRVIKATVSTCSSLSKLIFRSSSIIGSSGNEHVKTKGIVQKSLKTIFDVAEQFIAKVPDYKDTIEYAGESLILFEVRFDTVIVTKDLGTIKTLKL